MSEGRTSEPPGGDRQLFELVLGVIALAALGLGTVGVVRARRWAARRAGKPRWRTGLRLVPSLLPVMVLVAYPDLISFLMNGRTVTWEQLTYFPAPMSITLLVAALAGVLVVTARAFQLRLSHGRAPVRTQRRPTVRGQATDYPTSHSRS